MNEAILSRLYLQDTQFQNLMQQRVFNVLLIASPYDAFMMEEDGRVEEQLYFEYVRLNLSSPPRVQQVSDYTQAFELLATKHFDLVIAMPGLDISETFEKAKEMKLLYSETPIVVLTPFSREVSRRLKGEDFSGVDYVFSWLGNVNLLLAIIKLIEDKKNAENDILNVGVQMILVVEDSVHFYSSMLPTLYRFLLKQSMRFSTEALNEHEQMLRLRGRPKVLLARNYEEAKALYDKYRDHILGVITDVSFNNKGIKDRGAGLTFGKYVRENSPRMPIIVESSEEENRLKVKDFKGIFVDKNSKTFPLDIGRAISDNFGFGEFIILNPETKEEIIRIRNLKELQMHIFDIPASSFLYHSQRNDFSRWLYSRAMFPIAEIIQSHRISTIEEVPAARQLFFDLIVKYRKMKNRGVVAVYHRGRFDHYSNFARIGKGSLGGKGRGLAFIDSIIKKNPICDDFKGVTVSIPRTVVLCTDIFDEFMEQNLLYPIALSEISDEEILHRFLTASLPRRLTNDLMALVEVFDKPLAIRSSSLLEDSHYQPFAGVYSTYMIPNVPQKEKMIDMLSAAVKGVYASVFYRESKNYMTATRNVIDQEKMAVIIQEVAGMRHGDYYFPSFSGVGRSLNYYPLGNERPEDGVVEVAIGLGKYIVDGGKSLRFSPKNPKHVLQTSTLDLALHDTQTQFYALEMGDMENKQFSIDDGFNIAKLSVRQEAGTGTLKYMVSTFDPLNERIVDNDIGPGRRVVTFANMLRHDCFPLHEIADFMLTKGQEAMGRPVEIEFAGMVDEAGNMKGQIYWLQIRPIIDRKEMLDEAIMDVPDSDLILKSDTALGHGMMDGITEVVYVKPNGFSPLNNPLIAEEIERINDKMVSMGKHYILIGPGRWGSSEPTLGVPVKWANISSARLIVETSLPGYRIQPSQGTHFFQNLTSFGVGYFTIDKANTTGSDNSVFDEAYLNDLPASYESKFVRIVNFTDPLTVAINGRSGIGIVLKPHKI